MRRPFMFTFKLVATSVSILALLLFVGCQGDVEESDKDDLLTLFAGHLEDGTLEEACQELSNICQQDNMGCAAFELFCGGVSQEEICQQLGQTCMEQGVGCEVFKQQCEDLYQHPGPNERCCDLAHQCLAELHQRPCEDGNCEPTINEEYRCEGDPDQGIKCEGPDGEVKCETDADGNRHCDDCEVTASGEIRCDDEPCGPEGCGMPVELPPSCQEAMQVCGDVFPVDDLASGVDPYWMVEQYCEQPQPIDPKAECCAAAEMCIQGADKNICEPNNGQTEECKLMEPCQRAMEICSNLFPDLAGMPTGDIFGLYEQVCRQPPPPPHEGKCCEMARMCFDNGQFEEGKDPATGQENEFCLEAIEVCSQEFPGLNIDFATSEPQELMDLYFQVCQPEEPPPPHENECCAWAQMCAYDQECTDGNKECQQREECEQLLQKCGADFDLNNPQEMIRQACDFNN